MGAFFAIGAFCSFWTHFVVVHLSLSHTLSVFFFALHEYYYYYNDTTKQLQILLSLQRRASRGRTGTSSYSQSPGTVGGYV